MIPTMVSLPERQTLRDWVALNFVGQGEAVEIGAFCGGSAVAILQGLEAAKRGKPLHVYDVFEFPEGGHEQTYRDLVPLPGKSFRPVFDRITRNWGHMLRVVQGDASKEEWRDGPIEILHLDCSISRQFHESIALEFFQHLIVGATLIQQDFEYERGDFIRDIMARLEPWFIRTAKVGTTVYFVLKEKITKEEIRAALFSNGMKGAA